MSSLEGVFAAAVTPRRLGMQDINLGVMWDLIDFLVSHQVDGIVLLGSTGEFIHYSNAERMRLMGLAAKRSRVPVIFNVSHSTLDGAVELAQAADASGALAVLVMPPHFFSYTPEHIESYYRQFAAEAELGSPVLLYNIPLFTNSLPFEVTERLFRDGIASGIKDSSGSWENYERLRELRDQIEFTHLMGSDSLVTRARPLGLTGIVSGVASAVPELLVALNRALEKSAPELVTRLEVRLNQFIEWIDRMPVPVGIREAAAVRGIKIGPHAVPLRGVQERLAAEFREWFKGWLPDVQKECKHA